MLSHSRKAMGMIMSKRGDDLMTDLDEAERRHYIRPRWHIWHPKFGYNSMIANETLLATLEAAGWSLLYWVPEKGEFHD